ncbi:hypothetical protein [Acetobacter persici]|uniref:hypothetical protein n=1 Tax=Acetobacter persici TaxID=1076596 RepID=UPI0039E74B12
MNVHKENHAAPVGACQLNGVRGDLSFQDRGRDVSPFLGLEVIDLKSVQVMLVNHSREKPIISLSAKQAWLFSRLLYILQAAGQGKDANAEITLLLWSLSQGSPNWPPCDKVVGVNADGEESCALL